jgi:hypothetical protein
VSHGPSFLLDTTELKDDGLGQKSGLILDQSIAIELLQSAE